MWGAAPSPPPLHRWCHARSEVYARRCDWTRKLDDAHRDHSLGWQLSRQRITTTPQERDPLNSLVVDGYGW